MSVVENISKELEPSINESSSLSSSSSSSSHSSCNHWYARYGVCIDCDSTMDKSQVVAFDYLLQGFQMSHKAIALTKNYTTQFFCHSEKKLHLVLDLDHTLLHSIMFHDRDKYVIKEAEELWILKDIECFTKLRPFVHEFLKEASKMFRMYVYTMGKRVYATSVLNLIDPQRVYFEDRVITRDESPDLKTLDLVLADERGVVIVDDTRRVWSHHESNLVEISKYIYFRVNDPKESEEKRDKSENDDGLVNVLNILKKVHCGFFRVEEELDSQDVRLLLQEIDSKRLQ